METTVYSVKQFNELVNQVLQNQVSEVTVKGEISGYQVRQNKWVSFDLKDNESTVNCFTTLYQLDLPLADGQEVLVTGAPRIYVPYGKYSFSARSVQLSGEGALMKAFEALKKKLEDEGLFDTSFKRPLPRFPERIGIITSGEGAAINDILKVINGRWGGLKIFLLPVLVQGKNAPDDLVGALNYFNQFHTVDLIIFGRGGGSLEDLQAFNSERVARAIFASRIPIISGIGHEHNTSIADLVADVRAATPSNAAEIAVPDRLSIQREIKLQTSRAEQVVSQRLIRSRHRLQHTMQTLRLLISGRLGDIRVIIQRLYQNSRNYQQKIIQHKTAVEQLRQKLEDQTLLRFETLRKTIEEQIKLLHALNPKAILNRGYSITYQLASGLPVTRVSDLPTDGQLRTQLSDGIIDSFIRPDMGVPVSPSKEVKIKHLEKQQSTLF